jgi:hypothetical protein
MTVFDELEHALYTIIGDPYHVGRSFQPLTNSDELDAFLQSGHVVSGQRVSQRGLQDKETCTLLLACMQLLMASSVYVSAHIELSCSSQLASSPAHP